MRTSGSASFPVHGIALALLATLLLVLTVHWRIPMMLWDHLDLVPIYAAWENGHLADSIFLHIHGGHVHTAAYVLLLITTRLSHGHTWLDGVASWLLLIGYALVVLRFARDSFGTSSRRDLAFVLLVVLLALHPGHLANLQWGWQVAVFLCLFGAAATIRCLTGPTLSIARLAAAAAASALALASFATALALLPTALLLIFARTDWSIAKRGLASLPWIVGALAIAWAYPAMPESGAIASPLPLLNYTLNFLGAGISRFATSLSPWIAAAGIASGLAAAVLLRSRRDSLPWLGLFAFGATAAVLTAIGRAAPFGADHAFVTRYVSFSSTFWLGWAGLVGCAMQERQAIRKAAAGAACLVAVLAVANALHMIRKASEVARRTQAIAATIRDRFPDIDRALLGQIYFDQPDVALERLSLLFARGFAPFDEAPPSDPEPQRP